MGHCSSPEKAGQGKTHLFCDVGQRAVLANRPAVVLLGGRFSGRQVWSDIAEQLGLDHIGSEEMLAGMRGGGGGFKRSRFFLLLDALNEAADPTAWQAELPGLLAESLRIHGYHLASRYDRPFCRWCSLPMDSPQSLRSSIRDLGAASWRRPNSFLAFSALSSRVFPSSCRTSQIPLFLKLYCEGLKGLGLSAPPVGGSGAPQRRLRALPNMEAEAHRVTAQARSCDSTR